MSAHLSVASAELSPACTPIDFAGVDLCGGTPDFPLGIVRGARAGAQLNGLLADLILSATELSREARICGQYSPSCWGSRLRPRHRGTGPTQRGNRPTLRCAHPTLPRSAPTMSRGAPTLPRNGPTHQRTTRSLRDFGPSQQRSVPMLHRSGATRSRRKPMHHRSRHTLRGKVHTHPRAGARHQRSDTTRQGR